MAYKSKFLHFKTKASYNAERAKTTAGTEERKVFDAYISFIDEGPMICTWGKEYKCDISASEVEALVDAGKINPATVAPLIAGTAAVGTSTKYAREDHRHPAQTTVSGNAGTATKWATARKITVTGGIIGGEVTLDGSANVSFPLTVYDNSHRHNNTTIDSLDASKITSGTLNVDRLPDIPIEKLPAGALERLFIVASQSAAVSLVTGGEAQDGDTVQITGENNQMYFVVNDKATTFATIFKEYTAGSATSVPWSGVTGKPSTYTPTLGTSSTTAYAGDKGNAHNSIITTLGKFLVTGVASATPTATTIPVKLKQIGRSVADGNTAFGAESTESSSFTLTAATTTAAGVMTATDKTNLNTAYGWGNHASAGYAKTAQLANYLPLSGGTLTGGLTANNISLFDSGKTNDYNVTAKIGDPNTYSTPVRFAPSSAHAHYAVQFSDADSVIFGKIGGKFVKLISDANKVELTADSFYMGGNLVATQSWVTGKGYLTSVPAQTWASITGKPTFATVATSGSYNDLTNKPTIPSLSGYATQSWVTSQGYLTSIPTASTTVTGGIKLDGDNTKYLAGNGTFYTIAYSEISGTPDLSSYLTSIPVASTTSYGGIMVGYSTSGKNYAVQLSNGKAYVNVPWTDTNTTYSAGTNISISGTTINCTYSYTLPTATSSVLGGVKVGSNITLSSGTISLSKANVTSALGYTPANTSDIPEIPIALPNPYALTINGTSYTGSSAVSISTARTLVHKGGAGTTVEAGSMYSSSGSSITVVSGFSVNNPDAVIATSTKITSFPSSCYVMDGIKDLSGSKYVYCFTYIGTAVYVNGAVYA